MQVLEATLKIGMVLQTESMCNVSASMRERNLRRLMHEFIPSPDLCADDIYSNLKKKNIYIYIF